MSRKLKRSTRSRKLGFDSQNPAARTSVHVAGSLLSPTGKSSRYQTNSNYTPRMMLTQISSTHIQLSPFEDHFLPQGGPKLESGCLLRAGHHCHQSSSPKVPSWRHSFNQMFWPRTSGTLTPDATKADSFFVNTSPLTLPGVVARWREKVASHRSWAPCAVRRRLGRYELGRCELGIAAALKSGGTPCVGERLKAFAKSRSKPKTSMDL